MIPPNEGGTRNRRGQHVDFTLPPLDDAAGMMGVGRRGTIGAILSPVVDKNSMGRRVHRPFSPSSSSRRVPAVCPLFPTLLLLPFNGDVAWVVVDVAAFGAPAATVTWRLCMLMWAVMWQLCASMWAVTWRGMGVAGGVLLGGDVAVWLEMGSVEGGRSWMVTWWWGWRWAVLLGCVMW